MIIATAGHIDHGKTTLVRALTGVDGDRLKEEKARGITIELGYAYTPLPTDSGSSADVLGFIDVPGHERFIHTMSAGAVGAAHALLVVAADDGPMPQTIEHLHILALLGVPTLTLVITRADRVDAQRIASVRTHMQTLLERVRITCDASFATNATDPACAQTAALKAHLLQLAATHSNARTASAPALPRLFRLAIDRVFTLSGQGTIVTGTVFDGSVRVGDVLTHSATGQAVRVRSIHAQNRPAQQAHAGQRCALNLSGIAKDVLQRGHWIAAPAALHPSQRIDVLLHLLPDASTLQQWASVHVHIGTAHHMGHIALLHTTSMAAGESAVVQLVLDTPVFAHAGDRFIIRNPQATHTLGGGVVLDIFAPARRRSTSQRIALHQAAQHWVRSSSPSQLAALLEASPAGQTLSRLQSWLGLDAQAHHIQQWLPQAHIVPMTSAPTTDALLITASAHQQLCEHVHAQVQAFEQQNPDEPGLNTARLRRICATGAWAAPLAPSVAGDTLWRHTSDSLLRTGTLQRTGVWLHSRNHQVQLSEAQQRHIALLLELIHAGGFEPPWVRSMAEQTKLDENTVRTLLRHAARAGQVYQIVKDLFFSAAHVARLEAILLLVAAQNASAANASNAGHTLCSPSPQTSSTLAKTPEWTFRGFVTAAAFRDATGLGRKRAIQILEWFDRIGHTRRVGDAHLLRPGAQWVDTPQTQP